MVQECWIGEVKTGKPMYRCSKCGRLFESFNESAKHEKSCVYGMTREQLFRKASAMSVGRWFRHKYDGYVFFVAEYIEERNIADCKLKLIKELRNNLIQTTITAKKMCENLDNGTFIEIDINEALEDVRRICTSVYDNNLMRDKNTGE